MKKRGMVVASIAGIAGLAIGVGSLLSGSTGDSGDTSSFVVQYVGDGGGLQAGGEIPISTGQYSGIICGNGVLEWGEQCEGTGECNYLTGGSGRHASMPGVCNPNTCMCEQKTCNNSLDIIPSSNILKHDAGNGNFGGTYRLKPGSSTFDCKGKINHIFVNSPPVNPYFIDPYTYTLPLGFNGSLYCGPTTGGCYFDIKVSTGSTGTTCQDLKVGAGVRFVPGTSNNPKFGGTIYTKVGKRSIDCPSNPNTNNIKIYFSPRGSRDFKSTGPLNVNFEVGFEVGTYKLECGEYISYGSGSAGYTISCEYKVVIEQPKTVTGVDMKNPGM